MSNLQPATSSRKPGTVTVELALMLPMLMLLVMGALEFGRLFQASVVVRNAAREGARYAALGFSENAVRNQAVLSYLEQSGMGADPGVYLPAAEEVLVEIGEPGEPVSVYVPLWVEVQVPVVRNVMPSNPFEVGGRATLRRQ